VRLDQQRDRQQRLWQIPMVHLELVWTRILHRLDLGSGLWSDPRPAAARAWIPRYDPPSLCDLRSKLTIIATGDQSGNISVCPIIPRVSQAAES